MFLFIINLYYENCQYNEKERYYSLDLKWCNEMRGSKKTTYPVTKINPASQLVQVVGQLALHFT